MAALIADEWGGVDTANNSHPATALQNAMLMLNGPLLAVNATLYAYLFTTGDPLGLAAAPKALGIDLAAARQATTEHRPGARHFGARLQLGARPECSA